MVIGVVGTIEPHKGGALVGELAKIASSQELAARVVVIGTLSRRFQSPHLVVTGRYTREHLPELLREHRVTVAVIPTPAPETFCFVLQELMQMGLPVAALDLGAQGRKVRAYEKGRVAETATAMGLWEAASRLDALRKQGVPA
jgi:glycosyltransferase involved in cell wall biosynthesis